MEQSTATGSTALNAAESTGPLGPGNTIISANGKLRPILQLEHGVAINANAMQATADPNSKRSQKRARKAAEMAEKRKDEKEKKRIAREKAAEDGTLEENKFSLFGAHGVCRPDLSPASKFNERLQEEARKNRANEKQKLRDEFALKCDSGCKIMIDCDWESYMSDKERTSLANQIMFCFASNKAAATVPTVSQHKAGQHEPPPQGQPSHIIVSGVGPKLGHSLVKQQADAQWPALWKVSECLLKRCFGEKSEQKECESTKDVALPAAASKAAEILADSVSEEPESHSKPYPTSSFSVAEYSDSLTRENTVYLTADADETLTTFEPGKTYIIGGIVDRNRLKNCTRQKADHYKIPCAKLPIDEHASGDFGSFSRVLTVNQVTDIVLKYQSTGSWREAIDAVMPKRRVASGQQQETKEDGSACEAEEKAITTSTDKPSDAAESGGRSMEHVDAKESGSTQGVDPMSDKPEAGGTAIAKNDA
eukprot:TRINITY_DN103884_c0_g1_i1.p1 TRINITY_DN103884_c0_g1~~TRINITY_DN103884_c0_g1_i1.p1  ORF type:complete len:480 (+),score=60.14 TRINITY_DN103884_c0_g1_i1:50-1489(+)